jgi:hypothetical protein
VLVARRRFARRGAEVHRAHDRAVAHLAEPVVDASADAADVDERYWPLARISVIRHSRSEASSAASTCAPSQSPLRLTMRSSHRPRLGCRAT